MLALGMTAMKRTYHELIALPTFQERYAYLRLGGKVADETFGHARWLNQVLYASPEWRAFRDRIILRDEGRDLAMPGFLIVRGILIHHLNPITKDDILQRRACVFDPENVVCTCLATHNAIHYGDERLLDVAPVERKPNDTCPWRHEGG